MSLYLKSLSQLCLNSIRDEFGRYSAAYLSTENKALQKNLVLLQRVYTGQLYSELKNRNLLKEEYFDFLLNEHLKKFEPEILLRCSTKEKIIEKVLPIAHNLTEVSTGDKNAKEVKHILKNILPLCVNIRVFSMPRICDDTILKLVSSSCPNLEELHVQESTISGKGIRSFVSKSKGQVCAKCPLKHLDMRRTSIPAKDVLLLLRNSPTLNEVRCLKLPEFIAATKCGTKILNLKILDFSYTNDSKKLNNALSLCSERCPNVEKIFLPVYSAKNMDHLVTCFPNLVNLSLKRRWMIKKSENFCGGLDSSPDLPPAVNPHLDAFDFLPPSESSSSDSESPIRTGSPNYVRSDEELKRFLVSRGRELKELSVSKFCFSISTLIENCPDLERLTLNDVEFIDFDRNSSAVFNRLSDLVLQKFLFNDRLCAESLEALFKASPTLKSLSLIKFDFNYRKSILTKLSAFSLNCHLKELRFESSDVKVELLQLFVLNCRSLELLSVEDCYRIKQSDVHKLNRMTKNIDRKVVINIKVCKKCDDSSFDLFDRKKVRRR